MAKDQSGKEWETACSGRFVLFYAYTGITGKERRQKATAGIKSHLDIHLTQRLSIPIIP